ncbi:MFS nicotinic acid transporter Tna1 [Coprinopsis sp. MPI-PUGE-AT-0042]|nr:MFS nicotinic acid transporter Tna1 [Coprinopsis sp. MPI-PUGE-AT-0042]
MEKEEISQTRSPDGSFSKTELVEIDSKKLWRKVDMKLLPILTVMYLFSFMDRANIGNARLQGLETELKMRGNQFNLALTAFFITYCLFEVPSNLILKKFRPSKWLPFLTVVWGLVVLAALSSTIIHDVDAPFSHSLVSGFVKNFTSLIVLRAVLGAAEAGFYPGVIYYISLWYPRYMYQTRIAYFFGAASMAGAFSGLLAYAIGFMDGLQGLRGWSWIFIVEGAMTVVVGFASFTVMVDLPATAEFLTEEERMFVLASQKHGNSPLGEEEHFEMRHVWDVLTDWQLYTFMVMSFAFVVSLYGITFFSPTIINAFGYSPAITQLLSIPPYVLATIVINVFSYYADKWQIRSPFVLASLLIGLTGYAINFSNASTRVKYFGIFLCVTGSYAGVPGVAAWQANNISGHYKRGLAMALNLSIGNLGGIAATMIFRQRDSPRFLLGFGFEVVVICLGILSGCVAVLTYSHINARRDLIEKQHTGIVDEEELQERKRQGERAVSFRYVL